MVHYEVYAISQQRNSRLAMITVFRVNPVQQVPGNAKMESEILTLLSPRDLLFPRCHFIPPLSDTVLFRSILALLLAGIPWLLRRAELNVRAFQWEAFMDEEESLLRPLRRRVPRE